MLITIIIVSVIAVIIGIVYYVYYYNPVGPADPSDTLTKITPLNVKKDITTMEKARDWLLRKTGSTVMGFFKLNTSDRTNTYSSNNTDSFKPMLYIDNAWYLEVSSHPVNNNSARLRVKTYNRATSGNNYEIKEEIIELPTIPKQKWMFIAILREGRRFDVIYDNQLVASKLLTNYPVVQGSTLSIGSPKLYGSAIHVIIAETRRTPSDIEKTRVNYVDTNNIVLEDNQLYLSFPSFNLGSFNLFAQCPSGLPCDTVTKPPSNNLYSWNTPYI